MVPLSVLDLSLILQGGDAGQALRNTLDLARHCERLGFHRYWVAEHHNMPGVASAATSVVIGHIAAGTSTIRVGAGGIMLPNHTPLVIAEQFGTLESLYPGRIDLGLGRAPGSDPVTQQALRRSLNGADHFPEDVMELQAWFRPPEAGQSVRAVPGAGLSVPIWILGSSLFGAQMAAAFGLPFAFASHFAPAQMEQAITLYRAGFRPSGERQEPYVMLGVNVIAADTDDEARHLATSRQQSFVSLRRGHPIPLPPPDDSFAARMSPVEHAMLDAASTCSVAGSPETVHEWLADFVKRTGADEIMVSSQIYEHAARRRSFEIVAGEPGPR